MEIIGKVLWFDLEEGCGHIKDAHGRKYYFDTSVLEMKSLKKIKSGSIVTFKQNRKIKDCLCAMEVSVPAEKQKRKVEREFESKKQIDLF